jgi:hypothetical protein
MRFTFIAVFSIVFFCAQHGFAQSPGDLLNLLALKGTITQKEADSIRHPVPELPVTRQ